MLRMGQHFLTSKKIAERIAASAHISDADTVLEIGPGKGMLTDAILKKDPKKIIAVEKDKRLASFLKEKYKNETRTEIIENDIIKIFQKLSRTLHASGYKVVANIPYYLTSYLIRILLENGLTKPNLIVLMVQKEVAKRITAHPPHMNLLALSVQSMSNVRIAFQVTKKYFSPKPKVDSAVISISDISEKFFQDTHKERFFKLLHAGFAQKRKLLASNLTKEIKTPRSRVEKIFSACAIPRKARAENLSLEQWKCLSKKLQIPKTK